MDYPDISHLPSHVFINVEHYYEDIAIICAPILSRYSVTLEALLRDIIYAVGINANCIDSLYDLVDCYYQDSEVSGETLHVDVFGRLIMNLGGLISNQYQQLGLYSLDNTAYYTLDRVLSASVISIVKTPPCVFYEGY